MYQIDYRKINNYYKNRLKYYYINNKVYLI